MGEKTFFTRRHDCLSWKSDDILLISEFSKVVEYKTNIKKLIIFLYINNNQDFFTIHLHDKFYILHILPQFLKILFITASKPIKYLEINLTEDMKDLYTKIYKILLKAYLLNKWRNIHCSWVRNSILLRCQFSQIDL